MKTKICLLFGIFPDENYQEIFARSKKGMQNAADALQKSIISGLSEYTDDIEIINFPFIGSYPKNYSRPFAPNNTFSYNGVNGRNVRFFNGSVVKHYSIYRQAKKEIRKFLIKNNSDNVVVLTYSLNPSLLYACATLRKEFNFRIISIVPDLYQYTSMRNNGIRNLFKNWNYKFLIRSYKYIDGYVLLTEQMKDSLPIQDKPFAIVEGIYNPKNETETFANSNTINGQNKTILYTGTLSSIYGLQTLIEAFTRIKNPDYRLIICGGGADENMRDTLANLKDERVQFKGLIPRNEVLRIQKQASLLVNPRTPQGIYTKYSFRF